MDVRVPTSVHILYGPDVAVAPHACGSAAGHALALFFLIMGCAVLRGVCFRQEEEEEESDEDDEDDEDDEFDYTVLPEDFAEKEAFDLVHVSKPCEGFSAAGARAERVFVGVPVQVV